MKKESKNQMNNEESVRLIEGVEKLIYKFYSNKESLTEQEKQLLLHADQDTIRNGKIYMLLIMAKEYIQKGEIAPERLKELLKKKKKEVELAGMKEEWKKDPTKQTQTRPNDQETER